MAILETEYVSNIIKTLTTVNPIISRILMALLILLAGFIIARLLGKFVKRILHELGTDNTFKSTTGWKFSIENSVSSFVTYFTYFIAIIMALDTIGVTSVVLNMIAAIIILIVLLSFLLAIKDFVPNLVAGFVIKRKKDYKKGAKIKIKNIQGKLEEIGLLETKISSNNETIIVPNSLFTKHETIIKK